MKWVLFQDLKLVLNKTARKIERIFLTKPFFPGRGDKEEISKEIRMVILDSNKCKMKIK